MLTFRISRGAGLIFRSNAAPLPEKHKSAKASFLQRLQQGGLSIPGEPCAPSKLRSILLQPPMPHASRCPSAHPPPRILPEDWLQADTVHASTAIVRSSDLQEPSLPQS